MHRSVPFRRPLLALGLLLLAPAVWSQETIAPPVATQQPVETKIHGRTLVDPYAWLRGKEKPEVVAYLEAENRYTTAVMKPTEALQEKLYKELVGRIKETDLSVPSRRDDYYYYSRTEQGKQYPIFARKKGSLTAPEEVLLDMNAAAEGQKFFQLGGYQVSPDHARLAYLYDTDGSERFTLTVKDLATGKLLPDSVRDLSYGVAWANDNKTLFYIVADAARRPYRLMRHALGSDAAQDVSLYEERDEAFSIGISRTRSDGYLVLTSGATKTSELRVLDADRPDGEFRLVQPREKDVEYYLDHHGDRFYIRTNVGAEDFRVVSAPVSTPGREHWQEVIPARPGVRIVSLDLFRGHMVLTERVEGLKRVRVRELASGAEHEIGFPEPAYSLSVGPNPEFDTTALRFNYTSLVTPPSVYDYDMATRRRDLMKQEEVLGGYDPAQYTSERLAATAADGTRVPISIVYKNGFVKDGSRPCYLTAYGSYGAPRDANFSSLRLSLLDRGFCYAIAHIRGGGELGEAWYEQGRLLAKKNTFTDFIAAAEHLVAQRYTAKGKLAIQGGSAGGLLMGAVVNMRPDLFGAVIAKVPFVDVINTMLDATIPLTAQEFDEWGNPKDPRYFEYMLSYSPYDNVAAVEYPPMLVTTGLNDPRVAYWEPAKWVAKLRATKKGDDRLLLKTNMGAGHGGSSGRYDYLREIAFDYAFLFDVLGVEG
ncbi:MAG TPA: S9 family peptidase [Thermoanaerobaculia bacterium]|nr:S9 family peptidase [Thermoanaerobaculia bacterium]